MDEHAMDTPEVLADVEPRPPAPRRHWPALVRYCVAAAVGALVAGLASYMLRSIGL